MALIEVEMIAARFNQLVQCHGLASGNPAKYARHRWG
jgi:hypothetical protein